MSRAGETEPVYGRRRFLRSAVGAVGAIGGVAALGALAGCGGGEESVSIPKPVTRTEPVATTPLPTIPPTTTTTLEPRLTQALPPLVRTGPADRPNVAITIDDIFGASGADNLNAALDIARDRNAKLTFFPTGGAIEAHTAAGKAEVWRRVVLEGHEIGNHTYTHRALTSLPDQEIRDELNWTQKLLNDALGFEYRMRWMRPPGGAGGGAPNGDPRVMAAIGSLGYSMAMWSIDSNSTAGHDSYLAKITGSVRNGSVVLLHFQTFGLGPLTSLLSRIPTERGLRPVTMTQLVA